MSLKIALISMPWAGPNRPSLQLGTLRSYLATKKPNVGVSPYNYSLTILDHIDYAIVKKLSDGTYSSWAAEAISSYFLFPEYQQTIFNFLEAELGHGSHGVDVRREILVPYQSFLNQLTSVKWADFDLVGLSVSLCQTFSSVLAAQEIRKVSPHVPIILGGPAVTGPIGQSFLKRFPLISYVVNGEGEIPLVKIIDLLEKGETNFESIQSVISVSTPQSQLRRTIELQDLNEVPAPDYDQYFDEIQRYSDNTVLFDDLELPIEGSRGCWWDRSCIDPKNSCQFCNLNLQWNGYREKSVDKQIDEIRVLSSRHGVGRLLFVDNILRYKNPEALFEGISRLGTPFEINMEARAHISDSLLRLMKRAGVESVQIGIESLSTTTLKKIGKGTTAIQNVEVMKHMERVGIANPANIIYNLPQVTTAELKETLQALDFVCGYFPLHPVPFLLQYGSPYSTINQERGVLEDNHAMWAKLLPPDVFQNLFFSEKEISLRFEPQYGAMVQILLERLAKWKKDYFGKKKHHKIDHLLKKDDDGNAITIYDYRGDVPLKYELDEQESDVYRFYDHHTTKLSAREKLSHILPERIDEIVSTFQKNKLMFSENNQHLSLAV